MADAKLSAPPREAAVLVVVTFRRPGFIHTACACADLGHRWHWGPDGLSFPVGGGDCGPLGSGSRLAPYSLMGTHPSVSDTILNRRHEPSPCSSRGSGTARKCSTRGSDFPTPLGSGSRLS